MLDQIAISISKKEVEKAIINELYKKNVIDFSEYNMIIKKLDEEIVELENKLEVKEDMTNIVIKIPI